MRTRILVGSLLALSAAAVLAADRWTAPHFFGLLALALAAAGFAARELLALLPPDTRPRPVVAIGGVLACVAANWFPAVAGVASPWPAVVVALAAALAAAFVAEMRWYAAPGTAVPRLGLTTLVVVYLGVLPGFLLQLRWLDAADPWRATAALLAAITVPKMADVGAYFTGTFLGRHKMTPVLSPKKTWEGLAGGLLAAVAAAVGFGQAADLFPLGPGEAAAFGLALGVAGVFGDLAESLVKRDCLAKDAARSIPGFGGLLDVIDSVLFAAPVAYLWLRG